MAWEDSLFAKNSAVILRCSPRDAKASRAWASLEGWKRAMVAHPSRLAAKGGEHLRMTAERVAACSLHPQLGIDSDEAAVVEGADRGDAVDPRAVEQAVLQRERKIAAQDDAIARG